MSYYFKLIKNLLRKNVGKVIQIFIICISIYVLNTYPAKSLHTKYVISEFKDRNTWIYVTKSSDGYSCNSFEQRQVISSNGTISYLDFTALHIISIVLISFLSLSVIIASLIDDSNWEFEKCKIATCIDYVRLDEEGSSNGTIYIYSFNNKLIMKSQNLANHYEIKDRLKDLIRNPNLYLDYQGTKKEIRNKKLNNLLI